MWLRSWNDSKVTATLSDPGFQRRQGGIIRKREPYYNNVRPGEREVDVRRFLKRNCLSSQALQDDRKQARSQEPRCCRERLSCPLHQGWLLWTLDGPRWASAHEGHLVGVLREGSSVPSEATTVK